VVARDIFDFHVRLVVVDKVLGYEQSGRLEVFIYVNICCQDQKHGFVRLLFLDSCGQLLNMFQ